MACEILTDELQILVPRLFVPLNLRVTLVTLYQGPPKPGDSIPAASSRPPRGLPAAESRVARPPVGNKKSEPFNLDALSVPEALETTIRSLSARSVVLARPHFQLAQP